MADKPIQDLARADSVKSNDMFVLQQDGTAKRMDAQTLENWLLSMAEGHGGIQDIQKTGSNGFVDTYTITYADSEFTTTFTVTNGRGVKSFAKTNTQGLTDIYTMTYDDGTTSQIAVSNGKGIVSVALTGTDLLTDIYTITFNDGSAQEYTVHNGRGIKSWTGPVKDGLKDTYTITYDDNTQTTLTLYNGEKGDKGDNAYLHVKWASQDPSIPPHSIGDEPDNWRGECTSSSPEAPADWQAYKWFQQKGEKGDTGDPATLLSSVTEYQASTRGDIIPSGAWSSSIPANVPQGGYLWTRVTETFNSGSPVVSYSIARWGLDGEGSVSSVAGISPDPNGNVPLTAENVDALPITGGQMLGPIDMSGQSLTGLNDPQDDTDAARKGYVDLKTQTDGSLSQAGKAADAKAVGDRIATFTRPNLLDNWYFGNPVNQRTGTSWETAGYHIDRWLNSGTPNGSLTGTGLVIAAGGKLIQRATKAVLACLLGKQVTLSVFFSDGILSKQTFTFPNEITSTWSSGAKSVSGKGKFETVVFVSGGVIDNTQLVRYENNTESAVELCAFKLELGDTQTLAHQDADGNWVLNEIPDYGEQLGRCQRYLLVFGDGSSSSGVGFAVPYNATNTFVYIPVPTMRTKPSAILTNRLILRRNSIFKSITSINKVDQFSPGMITLDCALEGVTNDQVWDAYIGSNDGSQLILTAEL